MATIEEKVRRVEESDINDLGDVDIEDVYDQMDHMLDRRPTPLDLYNRWESQNWKVADLDFTEDAQHWGMLMEGVQMELLRIFTEFFVGEQAVTDTLSPLLHAAPTEDDRIFLSTQVVDEARHTVFFQRFFADVLGVQGGLTEAFETLKPGAVEGFKRIFDVDLVEATDRVRLHPTDRVAWARGITTYHFLIEGMLALTGQKFLLRIFRNMGMMPGFRSGFTAVARDESRHVNYGVTAIAKMIRDDATIADEVADVIDNLLEPAVKLIEPADRPYAGDDVQTPNDIPPQMRINPREVYAFSINSLTKRLRVAGIGPEICDDFTERGLKQFDVQIESFERTFDREHAVRFYDRGEVELFYPEYKAS